MPLYDCMLLLKPNLTKIALMDLVERVGKHVCRRNGVLTELKSFGTVQLGYGVKKLDGRYFQGMSMGRLEGKRLLKKEVGTYNLITKEVLRPTETRESKLSLNKPRQS